MRHTTVWNRLHDDGMEFCNLLFEPITTIEGKVIRLFENEKYFVDYKVRCDVEGNTEQVNLHYQNEHTSATLEIIRDRDNRWTCNGAEISDLNGIQDIDIGVTPSTNVLPIRRLNLAVGQSAELTTAWIRFPEFDMRPLRQQYERLAHDTYLYKSIESGYTAVLKVDSHGIVEDYEDEWRNV